MFVFLYKQLTPTSPATVIGTVDFPVRNTIVYAGNRCRKHSLTHSVSPVAPYPRPAYCTAPEGRPLWMCPPEAADRWTLQTPARHNGQCTSSMTSRRRRQLRSMIIISNYVTSNKFIINNCEAARKPLSLVPFGCKCN